MRRQKGRERKKEKKEEEGEREKERMIEWKNDQLTYQLNHDELINREREGKERKNGIERK